MALFGINLGLLDFWWLIHFLSGFLVWLGFHKQVKTGTLLVVASLVFIGWELFEFSQPSGGFGGTESALNALGDLIAAGLGLFTSAWVFRGK